MKLIQIIKYGKMQPCGIRALDDHVHGHCGKCGGHVAVAVPVGAYCLDGCGVIE